MQIGVGAVAVVFKTECLQPTVVVTLCQCREMDVMENNVWQLNFAVKSSFRLQRLWNSFRRLTVMRH